MEKKLIILLTMVLLIMFESCHAQCSNVSIKFRKNLATLVDLLTQTAPLQEGFYKTTVGNDSDIVYGVAQCKANISSNTCIDCLKSLTAGYLDGCEVTGTESISSLCTFEFSENNFFGDWSNTSVASYGDNGLDDPLVFSKGYSMMEGLASTVSNQPLMFQSANVDVGYKEKRYGLGQCSRDLSKSICTNCLEDQLVRYRSYVENRTGWEILGVSCSMWYANILSTDGPLLAHLTPSITAGTPNSTSPSQPQLPLGKPTLTSGSRRCHKGIAIGFVRTLNVITLSLAVQVFY